MKPMNILGWHKTDRNWHVDFDDFQQSLSFDPNISDKTKAACVNWSLNIFGGVHNMGQDKQWLPLDFEFENTMKYLLC